MTRFLWRHRWAMRLVHRWPIHRDPKVACVICTALWNYAIALDPVIMDSLDRGLDDYKAGRWYRLNDDGTTTPNPDWPADDPVQPTHR